MCSMSWLRPASGSPSAAEPVPIHSPRATERTDSIRSVTTRTPEPRTVSRWPSSTASTGSVATSGGCSLVACPNCCLATLRIAAGPGAVARAAGAARAGAARAAVALAVAPVPRAAVAAVTAIAAVTARAAAAGGTQGDELLRRLAGDLGVLGEAQADAAALAVDLDHADGDLVALVQDVLDRVHALARRHVGDVQQAVGALGELDERAERRRLDDLAGERVADLDLLGHRADALGECLAHLPIGGVDEHLAVVVDVDLGVVLILQAADGLAALADEQADLVRADLDADDARGVRRQALARTGDGHAHVVEDRQARLASLGERVAQDLEGHAGDLDVHLQGGDPVPGPGDLEVHVAQMVLDAGDVGEDGVIVALLDEAHRDAGHRLADRHAGIHQRQGRPAHARHR